MAQVGIAGLSPDAEPDPQQLAAVADLVEREDVRTIYTETLVSPAVAQTVADETGAQTAVLDPLEGLTDESAGSDYVSVMRANLETLREGQDCR
jgi:zinc transport system substrate-binding protein